MRYNIFMEMTLTAPIDGVITNIGVEKQRFADTESAQFKEVLKRENKYIGGIFNLFGPSNTPNNEYEQFSPSLAVGDDTTLENLKPALSEILTNGVEFWTAFIKLTKFSLPAEAQLALHERALGFLNGERSDTRSFREAVGQMAEIMKLYSEGQKKDRIDRLYEKESKKSPLWVGKLAYGKVGVLWSVGGSQICRYQESFVKHSERVKDIALRNID